MNRINLFVHIPKTAGGSVQQALAEADPVIIGHDVLSPYYVSLPVYLKGNRDKEIFSFCFVRNPWDRLVSAYHYLQKGGSNEQDAQDAERYLKRYADFDAFVRQGLRWPRKRSTLQQVHLRPQMHWVGPKGKLLVSWVGRFEQLPEDFDALAKELDITARLPHVNRSDHKAYREYYTPTTRKVVERVYAADIRAFGYDY